MTKKFNLVWVTEVYDEDEYNTYLSTDEHYTIGADGVEVADGVSTEDLIHFCENAAEGDNYHSFVDKPQVLANIMEKVGVDEDLINRVFLEIAEYGGLHRI